MASPVYRSTGIGKFLGEQYILLAKDLHYRASFFNLVFVSNVASVKLWRSLGFVETGRYVCVCVCVCV